MAIYVSKEFQDVSTGTHGVWESSLVKATDIGRIYDALVRDSADKEIDVDNGVALAIGDYTGNGLQERYATIAQPSEKIAVTGAVVVIKDAFTKAQKQITNFYNRAGEPVKTYEITPDDVFGISQAQITSASQAEVKVGAYIAVDGNGQWVASASKPTGTAFVGRIHSLANDDLGNYTLVRIQCIKNEA